MNTLRVGDLAFFDSFSGMIPCKVTAITGQSGIASTAQSVTATLTESRGAWKQGEQIMLPAIHIVPRASVRYRYGIARIQPYKVKVPKRRK